MVMFDNKLGLSQLNPIGSEKNRKEKTHSGFCETLTDGDGLILN